MLNADDFHTDLLRLTKHSLQALGVSTVLQKQFETEFITQLKSELALRRFKLSYVMFQRILDGNPSFFSPVLRLQSSFLTLFFFGPKTPSVLIALRC
jgi:hypothetical protein